MGQLHIELAVEKAKRRYKTAIVLKTPKVPYRETFKGKADVQGRHKKQTGGRGQFGEVWFKLEPMERGAGFEFVDEIVGGAIPNNYIPAVEKGVRETLAQGVLAGYVVEDVRVRLHFGKYHDVDSSEAAFKLAASMCFKEVFMKAKPVLLEPIVNLEITVPSQHMGDISGDLNSRRGRIQGMDAAGDMQTIRAAAPMAEVMNYSTELRSMTGGTGSFGMEFSHYDIVPAQATQKIIAKAKAEKEAAGK
jgi:elongation factor G